MATLIRTWLDFALQQMAAEAYLDQFLFGPRSLVEVLTNGNNNEDVIPVDQFTGATRFVDLAGVSNASQVTGSAQAFAARYQIVDHHANDATGFSATLLYDTQTSSYTLSFRSTEYKDQVDGGDYERDGANGLFLTGADGEILTKGFAFGQLAAMEQYYQTTVKSLLPTGALLNVTGYSLGAHLATVFTEMHGFETNAAFSFGHTYTFNGPGRGTFNVALPSESAEAQRMREMVSKLTLVLLDPDAGLPTPRPPDDQLPFGYILARNTQQADQLAGRTFDPFAAGNTASVYSDARYLWAKEVVSTQFGPLSSVLGDIPRTDGAFSLITQIVGHASQGDTEYVANSGNHAAETSVFIEDQPNFDKFGGFFGADGEFGTTHSITLIVDSLALQELFQTISPALKQTEIESMLWASSNELATGTTIGISGTAEAKPLEYALDALRRLFLPGPVTETAADPATGGFGNLANRNTFYTNIAAVETALAGTTVTIEPIVEMGVVDGKPKALPRLTPNDIVSEALQDTDRGLAFRYALKALNPFAVIGTDYQGLGHASNGALALFDPMTGFGELTPQYLADRAAFLEAKIELNLRNATTSGDTIYYKDFVGEGYEIPTGSIFTTDQRFLFGVAGNDLDLMGDSAADHLYGGDGDDVLTGQGGDDYLEGNGDHDIIDAGDGRDRLYGGAGIDELFGGAEEDRLTGGLDTDEMRGGSGRDVYYVRSGDGQDTIVDSDGLGIIEVDQRLLVGGVRKSTNAAQTYTSPDGQFRYVLSGSVLTITNQGSTGDSIVVQNFTPGQLGIQLVTLPVEPTFDNGLSTKTNGDFTQIVNGLEVPVFDETNNIVVLDGGYNYDIQLFGGNDSVISSSGNDHLFGGTGSDGIYGMEGHDRLDGGDEYDILSGGIGDDWLLGGGGDDDLDGGPGRDYLDAEGGTGSQLLSGGTGGDILIGGAGRDLMYGDTRDDSQISDGGDDFLDGGAGDDGGPGFGLQGGAGSDTLIGGEGHDWLLGDGPNNPGIPWDTSYDGQDYLDGGTGDDSLVAGGNDDILVGGVGNDYLTGDYNNVLFDIGGDDLLDGGDGADTLIGGMGNDTLYAGIGDDILYGDNNPNLGPVLTGGADFLDGEAGDDHLFGGMGNDTLLGGLGNDRLEGDAGNDFLDGGDGIDYLDGGAGFDTIHGGGGNDRLVAGTRTPGSSSGLATFSPAAFTSEPISEGTDVLLAGETTSVDQLFGDAGDDYLISAQESFDTDDCVLLGGSGDDTYEIDSLGDVVVEATGDGIDTVISYISYMLSDNFENLILRSLTATGVGNSLNNVLTGGLSLDGLDGDDTLSGIGRLDGGAGDDLLQGRSGLSFFSEEDGLLHYVANTYVFRAGDGHDRIQENDPTFNSAYYGNEDTLSFAAGISPSDVAWERSGDDLLLTVNGGTDRITIPSFYALRFDRGGYVVNGVTVPPQGIVSMSSSGFPSYVAPSRIEQVQFADRTVWNADHYGAPLLGDFRADTYDFGYGSGEVTVLDFDFTQSNTFRELDTIRIGGSGLPEDLTVARVNGDDLVLSIQGTTDRLTIPSFFKTVTVIPPFSFSGYSVAAYRIEQVQFADGTLWTASDLTNRIATFIGTSGADTLFGNQLDNLIQGLNGDDYLSGQGGNDVLDGGAGNDRLFGDAGNDTYLFGRGGGQDWLVSYDASGTDTDVVRLGADVLSSDVTIQVVGLSNDLLLRINGTSDQLLLDEFLWRSDYQIDQLIFGDGTVWDSGMILDRALGLTLTGTDADNTLRGSVLDDVLTGLGGNDTLVGNAGDDQLAGGPGDDILSGDEGDDTYVFNLGDGVDTIYDEVVPGETNRILFSAGISFEDLTVVQNETTLTITVGINGDRILLEGFDPLNQDGSLVVSTLAFADGSTVKLADLFSSIVNHAPTVANPLAYQTVPEDAPFSFVVPSTTFADQDAGDVLTLSASLADGTALPAWLTFEAETGTFTGTPDDAQVGTLDLRVTATDRENLNVFDVFTLTVTNVNEAPTIVSPLADQQATEDAAFNFVLPAGTFADVDPGDTLMYAATLADGTGLPAWLSFDPTTRNFSGMPLNDDVGTLAVTVMATDQGNLTTSAGFTLSVQNVNDAPTVATPLADLKASEDAPLIFTVPSTTFMDEDQLHGDVLTYDATLADGSPLPAWLSFNPNSGTFSGTPGAGDAGSFQIAVTATDIGTLSATNTFALVISGPLPKTLVGTAGNDVLTGGRGDDTLIGLAGNDVLDGGIGSDTMIGGVGNDIYVVNAPGDVVTELANEGIDTVVSNVTSSLSAYVEALVLTGSNVINGTGNSLNNGLTGNNTANVLDGGTGSDVMAGLDGDDVYRVDNTGDVVIELTNQGNDTLHSSITYTLGTNVENLTLTGTAAINGTGNALANVLVGNSGANVLTGWAGDDTYIVSTGDSVSEAHNSGIDTVQSAVSWTLGSNLENLILLGAAAINGTGNGSANVLTGNSANNVLSGANGADTLRGGLGNDTVNGGGGNDTFLFGRGDGQDLVHDNNGSADKMLYDAGINPLDLVISRQANDLRLAIHGSSDQITLQNWYVGTTNRTEAIQAGNGQALLSTQVDQLIQAMAGFTQQTGLTWDQAIDQRPQEVQTVLAASWQ